jgi:hypothetical protein
MDIEHPEFLNFLTCAKKNNLRYMCIGGYAVNYYGYHRATEDLDVWIAPTNENKNCFFETMICMGYTNEEINEIRNEDFTNYFVCSLGSLPNIIDVLTYVHSAINFDDAEKEMIIHKISDTIELKLVPYDFLVDIKISSQRPKDLWDVSQLDKFKNK